VLPQLSGGVPSNMGCHRPMLLVCSG
jgi:hypothetical protein